MIRNLLIIGVLIGLCLMGVRWVLEGPRLIALANKFSDPEWTAAVDYYTGELYYTSQSYPTAAVYFHYVITHFPKSFYAEQARLFWLESLHFGFMASAAEINAECQSFLKQYPESRYAPTIQKLARDSNGPIYGEIQIISPNK